MEPALSQFISVVSHSPAIHLGCVSNLLFGTLRLLLGPLNLSFLLWAKEAQFLQPLPTGHTVQPSDHLGDSAGLTQGHLRDPHIGNPQIDDFLTEGKERKGSKNSSYTYDVLSGSCSSTATGRVIYLLALSQE